MNIIKDIPELVKADVITQETADKIRDFYRNKGVQSTNRLFIVFGTLGAILVGLGIILIIAHNWDELSRTTKTLLALLPLLVGQILCGFALIKKQDSVVWGESGAAFLFFAVGASISLVSQIYNMPGNLSSFLLTWMLLCLPLIYVMKSSIVSLLYLIGITYYAGETSYWAYPSSESYFYWILLLTVIPHYFLLYKKKPESNFMIYHNWLIPLSVIVTLGTVARRTDELMFVAYFSLFGLMYLIGDLDFFTKQRPRNNGYKVLGFLGTIVLLLALSFDWFWEDLRGEDFLFNEVTTSPEFLASAIISLFAGGLLVVQMKNKSINDITPIKPVFILFIITFIIGLSSPLSVVLTNILILAIGILTIRDGAKLDNLGVLNYGLLIITALVVCRFFDTDLSFVIRGGLFVSVGIGFFATNYWMLKKENQMINKKILLPVFVLVAFVQLYVPAKMILDREDILDEGIEYKFKTEPIDPNDPFRGKYITLRYEENMIEIQNEGDWFRGETIYVFLTTDNEGFAKIQSVSKVDTANHKDFLKAKVSFVTSNGSNKLTIDYPFDRYYMEESKAYDAEPTYRESQLDTNQTAYALVNIKDGEAVLKDVLINGVSIREIVINEAEINNKRLPTIAKIL